MTKYLTLFVNANLYFGWPQGGQVYSRMSNPTCDEVEAAVNLMEEGAGSIVYGSGSAAIALALMTFLKSGDHVVR